MTVYDDKFSDDLIIVPSIMIIRGVTIHKIHSSVPYDTVVLWYVFDTTKRKKCQRNFLDYYNFLILTS